ncbi:hypothetical protein CY34DRAFT_661983 [Suillus luteus UH-Slu-Lm8-n1]|uniref:Unplaced genomic scaffold CY34scaffold_687, whole genome shotgun sequence n=1 Tax=Suillus luteus UH-Slu-Lm8-n1 TaxID=930992 RepID=A0A0D0A7D6_9AGAM|nr:hypothetical protein CY34DRAFT_661983 [Suillus luteus UH-Slu-Lm8-n1]
MISYIFFQSGKNAILAESTAPSSPLDMSKPCHAESATANSRGSRRILVSLHRLKARLLLGTRWTPGYLGYCRCMESSNDLREHFHSTLPSSSPALVSFRVRSARSALLPKLKLFALAESLGGVESLAKLPMRTTQASIQPAEREGLGIEKIDLVEDLRCALEGLEDEVSGLLTPSDVSDNGNGANGLR